MNILNLADVIDIHLIKMNHSANVENIGNLSTQSLN